MAIYIVPKKEWTKDGRKWIFFTRYKDPTSNKIIPKKSKKYFSKAEAKEAERIFLTNLKTKGIYINLSKTLNNTYERYKIEKLNTKNKESSIYSYDSDYNKHIKNFFDDGNILITEIDIQKIKQFKVYLQEKKKEDGKLYQLSTLQGIYSLLCSILEFSFNNKEIEFNPAKSVGNFSSINDEIYDDELKIRYYTPKEFNYLISVIDDIVDYSFISYAFWMGCRVGEQQALTWNDIDFDKNNVKINKTLSTKKFNGGYKITNTKNRKNRNLAMPEQLIPIMKELYEYYKKFDSFDKRWFVFGGIRFYPESTLRRKLKKYYDIIDKKYNNTDITPFKRLTHHELGRHSHATLLRTLGAKYEDIAARLGDTVSVVEKTYAHITPELQIQTVSLLNDENIKNIYK